MSTTSKWIEEWKERHIPISKLTCDNCGCFIGYVYDLDLEGSKFFCDHCAAELVLKGKFKICQGGLNA